MGTVFVTLFLKCPFEWRHSPEDHIIHFYHCEKLVCHQLREH